MDRDIFRHPQNNSTVKIVGHDIFSTLCDGRKMLNIVENCRTLSNNVEYCRIMSNIVEKCRGPVWGDLLNNILKHAYLQDVFSV